jgi:hypothetical protein
MQKENGVRRTIDNRVMKVRQKRRRVPDDGVYRAPKRVGLERDE